jgi:hypothetical protein
MRSDKDVRAALEESDRFFRGEGRVHCGMRAVAMNLDEERIPYAIVGGMALVAHGYERVTTNLDILVRDVDRESGRAAIGKCGEITSSVPIRLLVSGQFPGDGKPKPVAFPDPADVAVEIEGIKYVDLVTLVELKLASGISNPGRLKDLADVQELIKVLKLSKEFAAKLDAYVRPKFQELLEAVERDQRGG